MRGPGANLQGSDVPLKWLEQHADASRPGRPLWRSYMYVQGDIPSRKESVTMTIPTVADGVREGAEFLYVKVDVSDQFRQRYRIKIVD